MIDVFEASSVLCMRLIIVTQEQRVKSKDICYMKDEATFIVFVLFSFFFCLKFIFSLCE